MSDLYPGINRAMHPWREPEDKKDTMILTCDICYQKVPDAKVEKVRFRIMRCDPTVRLLCQDCLSILKEHGVAKGTRIIIEKAKHAKPPLTPG